MNRLFLSFLILFSGSLAAQNLPAKDVLAKSIAYHDPQNVWDQQVHQFVLKETRPNGADRKTEFTIDLANELFELRQVREENHLVHRLEKGNCTHKLNGKTDLSAAEIEKHRLNCERTEMLRNYYTYLWGLPMKLQDPGTILSENAEKDSFDGKDCWKIRVTYREEVGKDIWYFYFDQQTFALMGYRFYHDEAKNDGEYILLEEEAKVGSLRLPKMRKWYTHKEDKFLGADVLMKE